MKKGYFALNHGLTLGSQSIDRGVTVILKTVVAQKAYKPRVRQPQIGLPSNDGFPHDLAQYRVGMWRVFYITHLLVKAK